MSDKLDNIINSSFSNERSESAPDFVWGGIKDELANSSEVDAKVKNSFESGMEQVPEMVWEKVQDQLDVDRVWLNIVKRIALPRNRSILRYACSVLILLLPFALDYYSVENNGLNLTSEKYIIHSEFLSQQNSFNNEDDNLLTSSINDDKSKSSIKDLNITKSGQSNQVVKTDDHRINQDGITTFASVITEELFEGLEVLPLKLLLLTRNNFDPELAIPYRPILKRKIGITIGSVASLDDTWIIDNDTRNGFDSESIVENKISLASSYGAFVDTKLGRRYSIQGEYLFQSKTRQLTQLYINGEYSLKEREINTYKALIMLSRNFEPRFNGVTHSTSIRFGGYVSGVKSDYTRYNHVLLEFNSIYKRNDIGLRFEIGEKVHLRSVSIEGGIKGEYGLLNLASYKGKIPPHLNFTRVASVGAYIKLGYSF
ncbi:MAG: hypothetical protein JKY09_07375 [Crocinitomicaceae bacterium]|nr:hypothetical protein [Crocinitomicaceae bacterium]